MKILRFKTRKEFEAEFGENWREAVRGHWPYIMDHMLGQKVPKTVAEQLVESARASYEWWFIHNDMVKEAWVPRTGEIVVITNYSWGNETGTITKVVAAGTHAVMCEAFTKPGSAFEYCKKKVWYEGVDKLRPATEEEKDAYRHTKKYNSYATVKTLGGDASPGNEILFHLNEGEHFVLY